VGAAAPTFSVFTFEFKKIQFEQMRGKVVILNYWATWCGPCRTELPMLNAYYQRHSSQDLLIFAVDSEDDPPKDKLQTLSKALSFPLVRHLTGKGYGIINQSWPSNYVIDRAGVIRFAQAGAFTSESLESVVTPLLAEPAPAPAARPT
jgi:cytochrome c biogenesis protein CcmG/thiol:disulfide interchange protein DsbE